MKRGKTFVRLSGDQISAVCRCSLLFCRQQSWCTDRAVTAGKRFIVACKSTALTAIQSDNDGKEVRRDEEGEDWHSQSSKAEGSAEEEVFRGSHDS